MIHVKSITSYSFYCYLLRLVPIIWSLPEAWRQMLLLLISRFNNCNIADNMKPRIWYYSFYCRMLQNLYMEPCLLVFKSILLFCMNISICHLGLHLKKKTCWKIGVYFWTMLSMFWVPSDSLVPLGICSFLAKSTSQNYCCGRKWEERALCMFHWAPDWHI